MVFYVVKVPDIDRVRYHIQKPKIGHSTVPWCHNRRTVTAKSGLKKEICEVCECRIFKTVAGIFISDGAIMARFKFKSYNVTNCQQQMTYWLLCYPYYTQNKILFQRWLYHDVQHLNLIISVQFISIQVNLNRVWHSCMTSHQKKYNKIK